MVFTPEEDAFILTAHYRSATRNEDGTWSYLVPLCVEQFAEEIPNEVVDYDVFAQHVRRVTAIFESNNCICKGKSIGRPTILTEDVVEDIRQRMDQSPNKSLRQLSQQAGVSASTCQKAFLKNLHMYPYRVTVVQQVHPQDLRLRYCRWFNDLLNHNDALDLTVFTDEE